ncbi:MAG TPA: GNAT family N-acetyltransferase [Solirubrobacterales bacterium]|nr:GNAT family N-acetyltransferase [Solirubrobacterales bacterium]
MTQEVGIRAAEPSDIEELIAAYSWLFAPPGAEPPTWDERRAAVALRQAMESHDAAVLIATGEGGRIIGFVTGYLDIHSVRFGYRCWVEDLAVDPELRSRGVGTQLMQAIRGWARERGATHLELDSADTRADAHRFYEREGADGGSRSFRWDPV